VKSCSSFSLYHSHPHRRERRTRTPARATHTHTGSLESVSATKQLHPLTKSFTDSHAHRLASATHALSRTLRQSAAAAAAAAADRSP
jgi:hypothetical protein